MAASLLALGAGGTTATEPLRVFAAASLTDAFRELATVFEQQHPGESVELNLAGSQVLRTQIEQGAPADVFASADLVHAEALEQSGLLGPCAVLARNRVVVAVPTDGARVTRLLDLARPGIKVVVAGSAVPVGRYTAQVLSKMSASGLYGDDFQSRVLANVVSQETNVRVVLSKVVLGEADAGFVYLTDAATASDKIRVLEIPESHNVVAEYPIGVLTRSVVPVRARTFIEFVLGEQGQAVLHKYGFAR